MPFSVRSAEFQMGMNCLLTAVHPGIRFCALEGIDQQKRASRRCQTERCRPFLQTRGPDLYKRASTLLRALLITSRPQVCCATSAADEQKSKGVWTQQHRSFSPFSETNAAGERWQMCTPPRTPSQPPEPRGASVAALLPPSPAIDLGPPACKVEIRNPPCLRRAGETLLI